MKKEMRKQNKFLKRKDTNEFTRISKFSFITGLNTVYKTLFNKQN